jgi:uncharacterized delta-60 repeat protein
MKLFTQLSGHLWNAAQKIISIFLLSPFFITSPGILSAQPGTVDTSFGINGKVITDFGYTSGEYSYDVLIKPDGKIMAAGLTQDGYSPYLSGITQYLPDGTPDSSFGINGKVQLTILQAFYIAHVLALQTDQKILFCGTTSGFNGNNYPTVVRLNTDGTIDSTFAQNGYFIDSKDGSVSSIALDLNGKLIVTGFFETAGSNYYLLGLRLLPNGIIDSTFGINGYIDSIPAFGALLTSAVAIQQDGKIILAGTDTPNGDFHLRRFNEDGSVDSSFGSNGSVQTDIDLFDVLTNVIQQPDGKILALGNSPNYGPEKADIVRYKMDGSLDSSFGVNGKVIIADSVGHHFAGIALQNNGKIVTCGYIFYGVGDALAVCRFNPDGSADLSFNGTGNVFDTMANPSVFYSVAIQPDGKIVASGHTYFNFLIARYMGYDSTSCHADFTLVADTSVQGLYWGYNLSSGSDLTYNWNWGDGTTSVGQFPSHVYIDSGFYNICLMIHDTLSNCTDTFCMNYQILKSSGMMGIHQINFVDNPLPVFPVSITAPLEWNVFPNPLSANSIIQLTLAKSFHVKIELFDLQGRKIKMISEGDFEAGDHQITFQKENLNSGIYFLQLRSNNGIATLKLVVQ